jgi:hypothetical protein
VIAWQLERRESLTDRTLGVLTVDGAYFCWTLEPGLGIAEHPAIPEGTYPVRLRWSEHFRQELPHIDDVPGRTAIEIHSGNVPADTKGCVLVGERGPANDVSQSRTTLATLIQVLRRQIALDLHGVQLTVSSRQPAAPLAWD